MYKADSNGALTVQDTSANTGWQMIDGSWYYYKDGEILKDTYATIRGTLYYLILMEQWQLAFFMMKNLVITDWRNRVEK